MKRYLFAFTCIMFSIPLDLHAQGNRDSILHVKQTVDFDFGKAGTEESWSQAGWTKLTARGDNPNGYTTQFKILYSKKGIYCLYQSSDKTITSTLKGDFLDIYNEDVIEAFFWPDEEHPLYFEYELSPTNYELPILVPNNKGDFFGWRPWHYEGDRKTRHATRITQGPDDRINGWMGEFFIPFELLRGINHNPPQAGTRWRANFYRIDYDTKSTHWTWQSVRSNFHDFEMYGTIIFD